MYLSKIEIFGFKSFADKTTIEFDSGVSAIVGPNGSGKSNIVDAIRWVLGEQGDKALRSEKREDVVFSGTRNRKPLSVAEVSLTIQNDQHKLPTEYTEVQIARRFFRSGDTEYYLNGTRVRLKDIRHLFVNTGIGPDAYSVIELKMVETILSSLKNERRKLFEEAAGIVSYKQNRDLTFKRLESVHETLLRVNDIIKEKQRSVSTLERQAKKNEEAKLVFEELKLLEINVSKTEYNVFQKEIVFIQDTEAERILLKDNLHKEIEDFDIKSDSLRKDISEEEESLNILSIEIEEIKDALNIYERNNLVLKEKAINKDHNIERLSNDNENFEINIKKNISRIEELDNKIKVLKDTVEVSEEALSDKKRDKDEMVKMINVKKTEMSDLGVKLKEINKTLNESRTNYQTNKVNLENNLSQLERLSLENQSHLNKINRLEEEKYTFEIKQNDTGDKLKQASKELNQVTEQKQTLSNRISEAEKIINKKNLEHQKINGKISYLTNLTETLEDYAEGVKHLLQNKSSDDIYPVIDLVTVEEKFRIAIETALGEISNYLLLDDSKRLNSLVNSLKENNKGKVTFILNDKFLKSYQTSNLMYDYIPDFVGEPGVYGFANKLIKCKNEEFKILFDFLLDEYIIVEDINFAYKLSKDNYYKFITLEGDIVTENVIRTGSKINEENLKIGRKKQIEKLKQESEVSEIEKEILTNDYNLIKEKYNKLDLSFYQSTYDKLYKNLNDIKAEIFQIKFKISELNKSVSNNETVYKNINEKNKALSISINELIKKVSENDTEHSNLDKELSFLLEEFNQIEQKYSESLNEFNSFNLEFIKLKNELKNEEQNLNRINNSIEFQNKQIIDNKKEILKEQKELDNIKISISQNENNISEQNIRLTELNKKYDIENGVFEEKRKVITDIDIEQRLRRKKYDDISQKLIDYKLKIRENEIKSDHIINYIQNKYEIDISAMEREMPIAPEDAEDFDFAREKKRIDELSDRLKKLGGGYQQIIWDDFLTEKEELQKMIEQRTDLIDSEKDIKKTIERINQEARDKFMKTFEDIRQNFIRIFKELFQEGDEANLRLVFEEDEDGNTLDDPLEAKIEIIAKPRGKRPTSIELLSGGEKTLTAIALLFAIYLVKPSPFCILDEVDAPLDVANLVRFNKMIRKFSENTQFILITHNERTMERVDKLYGVTMQEPGVTTIVETKFKN